MFGNAKLRPYRNDFLIGALIGLGLLWGGTLAAERFSVQRIENLDSSTSLESQKQGHTWWARPGTLDPVAVSRAELEALGGGQDRPVLDWTPIYPTPGDLHENKRFMQHWKLTDAVRVYWYRKVFIPPAKFNQQPAIRLGIISDSDRVYLNGVLIAETGDVDKTDPYAYDKIRRYRLPLAVIRPGQPNILLVQTRNYFPHDAGIYQDQVKIGPAAEIFDQVLVRAFVEIFFLICYLTVGLYFLFLFFRRRRERENLFFGLFCLGLVLYQLLRNQLKYEVSSDFVLMKRIEYTVLFAMAPAWFYFVRFFINLPETKFVRWITWINHACTVILFASIIPIWVVRDATFWHKVNEGVVQRIWIVLMLSVFGILIWRAIKRDRDAMYMVAGTFVMALAIITDVLSNSGMFNLPRVMGFAFFGFILAIAVILANRFVRLNEQVEDLNRNLEKKVSERTLQLRNTLGEVQALKEQQDGDYFLTSLLVQPLGGDHSKSDTVSIEMLTRQKKQFRFRHRETELGGDLNSAHSIKLRDKPFTVVLNGDAMGKSVQGAGGALVLGTVFKSIITRTQMTGAAANVSPEHWLKSAFIELQNTFTSFDGSMLVSLILALIDDSSGLVYFINAEHPWAVIYRDKKAEFIEDDLALRKIGIEGLEGGMLVKLFQMRPDDVLLLGSDGRDDLLLGQDEAGRIINEDHTLFLTCVEEGHGHLREIVDALLRRGDLTDDLTLVRIGYREDFPLPVGSAEQPRQESAAMLRSAHEAVNAGALEQATAIYEDLLARQPDDPAALRELAQIYVRLKDHAGAVRVGRRYEQLNPADTDFLRIMVRAHKHNGSLREAAELGERVRLRDPQHTGNLVHLADTYRLLGDRPRARMLLAEAQRLEPRNESAQKLSQALEKA